MLFFKTKLVLKVVSFIVPPILFLGCEAVGFEWGPLRQNVNVDRPGTVICEFCKGSGYRGSDGEGNDIICRSCRGTGQRKIPVDVDINETVPCEFCQGRGYIISDAGVADGYWTRDCDHCGGTGRIKISEPAIDSQKNTEAHDAAK